MTNYGRLVIPEQLGVFRGKPIKHVDATVTGSIQTAGASITLSGQISGGSTITTRIGNLVRIHKIDVEFFVSSADATNFFKTYLLLCYNGQQSAPAFSSWYVPPDSDQYLILEERMTSLSTSGLNTSNRVKMSHRFPGGGLLVRYDTSTNTTEICNRIWLVFVSDSAGAPDPSVYGYARIYFTDS